VTGDNFDWQAKLSDYINSTGYTSLSVQNFKRSIKSFPLLYRKKSGAHNKYELQRVYPRNKTDTG
jgi:hypothetical protein